MDHCHSVQDRMSTMHALEVTKDAPELFLLSLPKKDLDLLHQSQDQTSVWIWFQLIPI